MKLNKVKTYDKDFTRMYNEVLQDKNLSWKARGIFGYLWSLPDTKSHPWKYREKNIAREAPDGLTSLNTGIKELRKNNYIYIHRGNDGTTTWYISDHKLKPRSGKPNVENPNKGKPNVGNPNVLQTTNHNKQSKSTNNQSDRSSRIEDQIRFDFRYYNNQVHSQQLHNDFKKLAKRYSSDILQKAVNKANKYQLKGEHINYPPKYISKIASQLKKKSSSNYDDGFVDNSGVDMMAKARKQTKQAVAKLKKEGKIK